MSETLFTVEISPAAVDAPGVTTPPEVNLNTLLPFAVTKTKRAKATLPTAYSEHIFFHTRLATKNSTKCDPLYDQWKYTTQKKPVRMPLGKDAYVSIVSAKRGCLIQFRIDKFLNIDASTLIYQKFALAIFECTRPFETVTVTISDRLQKALPELTAYLKAYAKIQAQADLTQTQQSNFTILNENGASIEPSDQAAEEALQAIAHNCTPDMGGSSPAKPY